VSIASAKSWQLIADRLASESSERRRDMLAAVAEHVVAEVGGDIPALMATMVPEPQYHFWGNPSGSPGPRGRAETEAHYQQLIATGMSRLEFVVSRVVVDDENVVTEGLFRHALSGGLLGPLGASADGLSIEPGRSYLVEYLALVIWPITPEGKIAGEDIYFGTAPTVVRALEPGELPHLGLVDRI
jgi:hypothetical protein